jgi:GNAT superfamily N-acetyltransferase
MDAIKSIERINLEQNIVKCRIFSSIIKEIVGESVIIIGDVEDLQNHPNHPDLFQVHDYFDQLKKKCFSAPSSRLGFILNIDVKNDFRRKGIGRELINQAENVALSESVGCLIALVIKNDEIATGFWNTLCRTNNWQKTAYILNMVRVYEKPMK